MSKKILTNIDLSKNEIQNAVVHKLSTAPLNPVEGQFYYNTSNSTTYQWNGTEWVAMNGGASVEHYGVCSTSQSIQIKQVSIPSVTELYTGLAVTVKFTYKNVQTNPKLKINNLDAVDMMQYGTTRFSTDDETNGWYAGSVLSFVYDGANFVFSGKPNTNTVNYYTNTSFMNVYGKHLSSSTGTNISVVDRTGNNIYLNENGYLTVKFEIDVLSNAVMNVSSGGSHSIYHRGNPITTGVINAGDTALFIYKGSTTDGTWELLAIDKGVMQGATNNSNGKQGYVPTPISTEWNNFLSADGKWRPAVLHLKTFAVSFSQDGHYNITLTKYDGGSGGGIAIGQQEIIEYISKGGIVIFDCSCKSGDLYRRYTAENDDGQLSVGNIVFRNVSYENGRINIREYRESEQTEGLWTCTEYSTSSVMQVYLSGLTNMSGVMTYTESTHSFDEVFNHINNGGIAYVNTFEGFSYNLNNYGKVGEIALETIGFVNIDLIYNTLNYKKIICRKYSDHDTWTLIENNI